MKKTLSTICVLVFLNVSLVAQEKASLTKDETVRYLEKKIKEIVGHYRTPNNSNQTLYYTDPAVTFNDNLLRIKISRKNYVLDSRSSVYVELENYTSFNPKDIKEIKFENRNDWEPVGVLKIIFTSQVCKETMYAYGYTSQDDNGKGYDWGQTDKKEVSTNEALIPFLAADNTNFTKIKKALEYLRDLCKAEDDPFGE